MKTILIVLNGEELSPERLTHAREGVDIIIAADGGANYCLQQGIKPNYIIGDLDSIRIDHTQIAPDIELIRLDDQYSTDLEKAMKLAETLHGDRWRIINATGKRSDHALANVLFLAHKSKVQSIEIFDTFGRMRFLHPGSHTLHLPVGQTISFIAFNPVRHLSLHGFEYPLSEADFPDFFVGISNVVRQPECRISFEGGMLLMYQVEKGR
jgi:thiamine pyrophosphokinase